MAPPEGGGSVVTLSEARFKQMQASIRQTTEENGVLRAQLRDARGSTSDRRADGSDNPRGSGPRPLEVRGPRDPREHRTITQLQNELEDARATTLYYERTFSKVERKAAKWKELAETYYAQTRGLWDANQSQEAELNIIRSQLQDAQSLASIRGKELVGSQVFLTKADSLSVSDIVQKVDQLNDEIYQASAFLGESIAFGRTEMEEKKRDEFFEVAMDVLGLPLVKVLSELSSHAKPTIHQLVVQIAWQVLLCKYCLKVATSWYPNDGNAANFLSDLYSKIRDNGANISSFPLLYLSNEMDRGRRCGWSLEISDTSSHQTFTRRMGTRLVQTHRRSAHHRLLASRRPKTKRNLQPEASPHLQSRLGSPRGARRKVYFCRSRIGLYHGGREV